MNEIRSLHSTEFGREPEVIVSAPGTANLIGEHTDYGDGLVIEAAIDRYLRVAVSRRDDNSLRYYAPDLNERKRTTIQNLKYRREDRWANYPKGVLYELMQLGYEFSGIDLTVTSDIPTGIGLGSSAAFSVASAIALSELFEIELSEFQIVQSAFLSELSFMGIETSITDHLVSAVSRESRCLFVDLRELDYEFLPLDPDDLQILVIVSNVPNVFPAQDLAVRRAKCADCTSFLKQNKLGSSLRDLDPEELRDVLDGLPEDVRRVCSHVVEENDRVRKGVSLLKHRKFEAFGKLMAKSHDSLRDNYEVSCPEIDWLVKRAGEIGGIFGSRMTGPGFGGCTVSLVRKEAIEPYLENIEDYERIFGFKPEWFVMSPAAGVRSASSLARNR
jgi:galactokinase